MIEHRSTRGRVASRLIAAIVLCLVAASCRIPTTEEALAKEAAQVGVSAETRDDTSFSADSDSTDAGAGDDGSVDLAPGFAPEDASPGGTNAPLETQGLAYSGPGMNSHWHAAYAVRICDELIAPFTSQDDPLGIHSHGDGLIHIHPFFPEAAWQNATLAVFADAMGIEISDGLLTIPGVGEWRDGDECDGVPSRLSVKRWARPTATEPYEIITEDLADIRFVVDGELFTIAFAPEGRLPIRPPGAGELYASSPSLAQPPGQPFVSLPDSPDPDSAQFWVIAGITEAPCRSDQIPGQDLDSPEFCYDRGRSSITSADIVSAQAMWINNGPGVVIDLAPAMQERLNQVIAPHTESGGIRLALEIDGQVVITVALLRPLGDNRLAFVGGMTVEQAQLIAGLFGDI